MPTAGYEILMGAVHGGLLRIDVEAGRIYYLRGPRGRLCGVQPRLNMHVDGSGREAARFVLAGTRYRVSTHRAVWMCARGPIPARLEVDHVNGNHRDNRLANLELVTRPENQQRAQRLGLWAPKGRWPKGSRRPDAALAVWQVKKVHRLAQRGLSYRDVAAATGVARCMVAAIRRGSSYAWVDPGPGGLAPKSGRGGRKRAKLTPEQVRAVRVRRAAGERVAVLARACGVSTALIYLVVRRRVYADVE